MSPPWMLFSRWGTLARETLAPPWSVEANGYSSQEPPGRCRRYRARSAAGQAKPRLSRMLAGLVRVSGSAPTAPGRPELCAGDVARDLRDPGGGLIEDRDPIREHASLRDRKDLVAADVMHVVEPDDGADNGIGLRAQLKPGRRAHRVDIRRQSGDAHARDRHCDFSLAAVDERPVGVDVVVGRRRPGAIRVGVEASVPPNLQRLIAPLARPPTRIRRIADQAVGPCQPPPTRLDREVQRLRPRPGLPRRLPVSDARNGSERLSCPEHGAHHAQSKRDRGALRIHCARARTQLDREYCLVRPNTFACTKGQPLRALAEPSSHTHVTPVLSRTKLWLMTQSRVLGPAAYRSLVNRTQIESRC